MSRGLFAGFLLPGATLASREMTRFFRQRSRVIGAVLPPVIFWFLIGSGLGRSFRHAPAGAAGQNYLEYFFPGTIILIVLFTAIFSTISVIEDRREGFLQSVITAPVSRASIAFGKILGGTGIALLQGTVFVVLAPLAGVSLASLPFLYVFGMLFVISFALTGLGFAIAWRMDSAQGFHSVMNLFLMPMWFLSGSLFPMEGAPGWLKGVMTANPLTYGVAALRHGFYGAERAAGVFPSPALCFWVSLGFGLLTTALSVALCTRRERSA
ncbi:MAG: hypothetical protein A2902_04085 [Elusimicrobia bacterium RIFCSPLOWO2_01_FULL_64_13]|nr:MAG: hypothetical protein A2636_01435 [Elusimicrobia bacterium RIFCSPHIGHO2_01_FULL_64_10]OGR96848.1 MAG: hypothetical protein A2902_04085 [Elusimicrobia bacterium RIFCSPLOWO2_01_FULL_64_13]